MQETTNYGLKKPEENEWAEIEILNQNMDKIDKELKEIEEPTYTEATTLTKLTSGEKLSVAMGKIAKGISSLITHLSDTVSHVTSTEKDKWNKAIYPDDVDSALSATSENPVQNKAVKAFLDGIINGSKTVGNADKINGIKVYYNFSSLNSSFSVTTPINDILAAIPDKSILIADIYTPNDTTIYPAFYGILKIHKMRSNRIELHFTSNIDVGNAGYRCHWIGEGINNKFSGWCRMYTDMDKPTPADIGAVATTGSELTGYLRFNNLSEFYAFWKNREISNGEIHRITVGVGADGASAIEHYTDNVLDGRLEVHSIATYGRNALRFKEGLNGANYRIFGEHNKPSGSYVGNGDATKRVIDVGGIGFYLSVHNSGLIMFVTNAGAFILTKDSEYKHLDSSKIKFENGILTINSNDALINGSGGGYYYQVL